MLELNSISNINYSNNFQNIETIIPQQNNKQDIISYHNLNPEKQKALLDEENYFIQKEIKYLADKFEKSHLYTKEASKIVAKQIVIGTIEFFA